MPGEATLDGLTAAQVARRRADGRVNVVARRTSRSLWAILPANVLTRFNAIIGTLLAVVLVFGPPQDGLFGLVVAVPATAAFFALSFTDAAGDAIALVAAAIAAATMTALLPGAISRRGSLPPR